MSNEADGFEIERNVFIYFGVVPKQALGPEQSWGCRTSHQAGTKSDEGKLQPIGMTCTNDLASEMPEKNEEMKKTLFKPPGASCRKSPNQTKFHRQSAEESIAASTYRDLEMPKQRN
jgi:hypothetical protein